MLALGMLIVHVAFEVRIEADDVPLLHGSECDQAELVVTFGVECVEFTAALGTGYVVLSKMIGLDEPGEDPNPVGCAYPWSLDGIRPSSLMEPGLDDGDDTGDCEGVASKEGVVKVVPLEYGA
jgi:hypothetical protein